MGKIATIPHIKEVPSIAKFSVIYLKPSEMSLKVVIIASFVLIVVASKRQNQGQRTHGAEIRPAQDDDDDFCLNYPDHTEISNESCFEYYGCDEFNNWVDFLCPEDLPIFDSMLFTCVSEEGAFCHLDDFPQPEIEDGQCPREGNGLVFLRGESCEEYYICINGEPNLLTCRNGQHWNEQMNYCDYPHEANCDANAEPPSSIPDCKADFVGALPHPQNCSWFVYCDRGNRFIQQCPHMFHFDVDDSKCLFRSIAKCIRD